MSRYDGFLQHDSHPDQTTGDGCTGKQKSCCIDESLLSVKSVRIIFGINLIGSKISMF